MTVLRPSLKQRSRFLLDWDAASCLAAPDQSLDARTGQVATYSRASVKSAYDANGVLRTVPHSMPAFEWATDPVTGLSTPGVLLEDARTNLALHSRNLAGAAWTTANIGSIISDGKVGPDGTTTADAPIETATTAEHYTQQQLSGIADNTVLTWAVSAQAGRQFLYVSFVKKDGATVAGATFDITNGTVSSADAGITARIRAEANGFFRCIITGSVGAGATQPYIRMQSKVAGSVTFLGVVGTGYWATDMQCEAAAFESSRIMTTTATVTRPADSLTHAVGLVPRALTMYAKFIERSSADGVSPANLVSLSTPGTNGSIQIYRDQTADYAGVRYGTTLAVASVVATPAAGSLIEVRVAVAADGSLTFGTSVNGAAESTTTSANTRVLDSAFSAAILYMGYDAATTGKLVSAFQKVRIAAGVQSLAFMQAG